MTSKFLIEDTELAVEAQKQMSHAATIESCFVQLSKRKSWSVAFALLAMLCVMAALAEFMAHPGILVGVVVVATVVFLLLSRWGQS